MPNDIISIVVNVDSRPGFMEEYMEDQGWGEGGIHGAGGINGIRSLDYFTEGVINKIRFFEGEGYDLEVTLFIDIHEPLPEKIYNKLVAWQSNHIIQNLVFSQHSEYHINNNPYQKWNDINFLNAIILSRGKYLVHFDGDVCAFKNKENNRIKEWIQMLNEGKYDYVSYPSRWSPMPAPEDPNEWEYLWASTRFFMCKREIIDYTEIVKCLNDSDYMYGKYGDMKRKCPWLEHVLGIIAGDKSRVHYPTIKMESEAIFSWHKYYSGTLETLNNMGYGQVMAYLARCGGIQYPCDIYGVEL